MRLPDSLTDTIIQAFRDDLGGTLIRPGEGEYDHLRAAFNRYGSPAFIVQPVDAEDISKAVLFAKAHNIPLSIRSGGHGLIGAATNDGGVVVDLSPLRSISLLDKEKRLVRIETGAVWGEVAEELHKHKLAITSGDTPSVGVGGLITGGGIGWMVRKYGLTIDSVTAAEVITANGMLVRTDKDYEPDLFWAIRGGGGNFGVVTAIEVIAQPETEVVFGSLTFNADQDAAGIIRRWRDLMAAAPNDLTTHMFIVPQTLTRPAAISLTLCYANADANIAKSIIEPLSAIGPLIDQDLQLLPYAAVLPNRGRAHFGHIHALHRNQFMKDLTDEAVQIIAAEFTKPAAPMLQLRSLGGAMNKVDADATAFAHRDSKFLAVAMQGTDAKRSLHKAWQKLAPFGTGSYVNFLDETDETAAALAYPPATLARLKEVKRTYDPDNLFRNTVNIVP